MESKRLDLYRIRKLTSTWNQKYYIYIESQSLHLHGIKKVIST